MRARGINYDTGFLNAGTSTHEPFVPELVRTRWWPNVLMVELREN